MKAVLTADRGHVILKGKHWSSTFPVEGLDRTLAFYKKLGARPGRTRFYAETIVALKAVQDRLKKIEACQ